MYISAQRWSSAVQLAVQRVSVCYWSIGCVQIVAMIESGRVETGRLLTTSEQSKGVTGEDAFLQQSGRLRLAAGWVERSWAWGLGCYLGVECITRRRMWCTWCLRRPLGEGARRMVGSRQRRAGI